MNVVVPDLLAARVSEVDGQILPTHLDHLAASEALVPHPISDMKQECSPRCACGLRHKLRCYGAVLRRRERVSPL